MVKISRIGSDELLQAVKDNDNYCLCAVSKTADTKCMCKEFRELETTGVCHCGLYEKIVDNN